ncbi:MAG TPA: hypothetical protein IAC50_01180 [Candidatus Copromorpha excrementigallinarum]|uniref:Uncharacterized protein n=1 Tax=Candidatus Allocopromorpha excrementigallinarum TaxID=2840742 RepID=A0A9D1HZE6_9FIRM|nr:hypothetical protein [Candidatus Copromorpha excrementigallinarum]
MISKINNGLRIVFLVLGAIFFILKLTDSKKEESISYKEGFQREKFDDIW